MAKAPGAWWQRDDRSIRLDGALSAPVSVWGTPAAPSYTVMDAEPLAPAPAAPSTSRPAAGQMFQVGAATFCIVGLGVTFIALGSGAGFIDAVRAGAVWGGSAAIGGWLLLGALFLASDLGRSFEVQAIARVRQAEIEAHRAIEMRRLDLQAVSDRERAVASQTVALAELEHSGRLREEHQRHFELAAGQAVTSEPIADPLRALVQQLLLDAYKPSSQDLDGSGRLVAGIISREKVMAAGFTKAQYEDAKRQLESAGVLTYGTDRRWRLDRVRYPAPQDGYRAVFGENW